MRGRKPKPVEQRIREGNPSKRPLPEPIKLSDARNLTCPEDWDEDAKECWRTVVPTLEAVGVLDGVDRMALESLCLQWARARAAARVIEAQGMFAKGSTGQLVEHPAVATERNAQAMFLRFAEQYALTPVARTRLGIAELERKKLKESMDEAIGPPELTPA